MAGGEPGKNSKLLRVAHGIRLWEFDDGGDRYGIETPGEMLLNDSFDDLPLANRVFDKLVKLSTDQREALWCADPAADSILDVTLDLQRHGGHRTVWGILKEDACETSFGDGYRAYLEAVFDSEDDAKKFPAENPQRMINWHIRKYEMRLMNGEPVLLPEPTAQEPVNLNTLLACRWSFAGWRINRGST